MQTLDNKEAYIQKRYNTESVDESFVDSFTLLRVRMFGEADAMNLPVRSYVPSTFQLQKPQEVVPLPQYVYPDWVTLRTQLSLSAVSGGVLFLVPPIWQLLYSAHTIVRSHGLFSAAGSVTNIPLCVEMVRQASVSVVVTYPEAARLLATALCDAGCAHMVHSMIVISDAEGLLSVGLKSALRTLLPHTTILFELQIVPGYSVAHQSFALAAEEDLFHMCPSYVWNTKGSVSYVTGVDAAALPVYKMPLSCVYEMVEYQALEQVVKISYV